MTRALQRALALVLTCAVVVGPFTAGGVAQAAPFPCDVTGQITKHPTNWFSVRGPQFPAGPQLISSMAVEPVRPSYIYVTNGVSVMRTTDGGCHWQTSYTLPASSGGAGVGQNDSDILEVEVSAPGVVYLPIQQDTPAGNRPRLLVSTDAGGSWRSAEGGAFGGIVGKLLDFDAPLSDPGKAYALVNVEHAEISGVAVDSSQVLLETNDAGANWSPRELLDDGTDVTAVVVTISSNFEGFEQITADPVRGEEVWLFGGPQTIRSTANGPIPVSISDIGVLEIAFDGSMALAYPKGSTTGYFSTDLIDFSTFPTGVTINSAAAVTAQAFPPLGAAGGLGRAFFHAQLPGDQNLSPIEVTPADGRALSGVRVGIQEGGPGGLPFTPLVIAHTTNTIEIYELDFTGLQPQPDLPGEVIADLVPPTANREPGVLVPRSEKVVRRPGQAATVGYGLTVPAASTPLDVYFLIDVSGSMDGTIDGVRASMQEIADRLAADGADAQFGVGAFRAFGDPPAYARVRDIGPPDADLARALNSLQASGGGAETQMTALYQSVTGEGEPSIPPDLDMSFRPGSLRVAILSTDEPISQGGQHKPVPVVIEALKDANVKQVALAIQEGAIPVGDPNYSNPGEPAATLQTVARGSEAIAPAGGVDCDGDQDAEIPEGGPIVCILAPTQSSEADIMADAIVNVLNAVQDIQDVGVSIGPSEAKVKGDVVESVTPSAFPETDLKQEQDLQFAVTVRCPDVDEKTSYPLDISVGTANLPLGSADLTLVCNPKAPEPPPPIPPVFVPVLALPFPPVRPPEPIPEPNPNPQPNPQGNPQAQAGLASQEQKQPQLATVHQESQMLQPESEEAGGEQFLMTNHQQNQGVKPEAVIVATGAVLMSLMYGFATMRREQLRTQQQQRRKPF